MISAIKSRASVSEAAGAASAKRWKISVRRSGLVAPRTPPLRTISWSTQEIPHARRYCIPGRSSSPSLDMRFEGVQGVLGDLELSGLLIELLHGPAAAEMLLDHLG